MQIRQIRQLPWIQRRGLTHGVELCGVDHARMLFNVRVVERAEYDAYIADLKARGQSGVLDTGMSTDEGQMPDERTT